MGKIVLLVPREEMLYLAHNILQEKKYAIAQMRVIQTENTVVEARNSIAAGADIKSVQDLLGHATASFTLNVYAHTSDQMKKDTAARMQSYYDNLKAKQA